MDVRDGDVEAAFAPHHNLPGSVETGNYESSGSVRRARYLEVSQELSYSDQPQQLPALEQPASRLQLFLPFFRDMPRWSRYKALTITCLTICLVWMSDCTFRRIQDAPSASSTPGDDCELRRSQLLMASQFLVGNFYLVYVSRLLLFIPRLSRLALQIISGEADQQLFAVVVLHSPLFLFSVFAINYWILTVESATCEVPLGQFYINVKVFATGTNIVSAVNLVIWHWRRSFAVHGAPRQTVGSMSDNMIDVAAVAARLELCTTVVFAEHPGMGLGSLGSECAICLGTWSAGDIIKLLVCGHAYHEVCIKPWLLTKGTCALCRFDIIGVSESQVTEGERSFSAWDSASFRTEPPVQPLGLPFENVVPLSTSSPDVDGNSRREL